MLISFTFWSAKLFIMKGVKRKNPESKVEGTFKIRGEFSRHNVGLSGPLRRGLCRTYHRLNLYKHHEYQPLFSRFQYPATHFCPWPLREAHTLRVIICANIVTWPSAG